MHSIHARVERDIRDIANDVDHEITRYHSPVRSLHEGWRDGATNVLPTDAPCGIFRRRKEGRGVCCKGCDEVVHVGFVDGANEAIDELPYLGARVMRRRTGARGEGEREEYGKDWLGHVVAASDMGSHDNSEHALDETGDAALLEACVFRGIRDIDLREPVDRAA